MQPEDLAEARDWLARAERDVLMARRALHGDPLLPDQAAYHAQQAAEKVLKGFLAARAVPFPKTHDLVHLVGLCQGTEEEFPDFLPTAQALNPYATGFRYPGGPLAPDVSEAEDAIQRASALLHDVADRLQPSDVEDE